jgi:hypothetical protein
LQWPEAQRQLENMGYGAEDVASALVRCNGDLNAALNVLMA